MFGQAPPVLRPEHLAPRPLAELANEFGFATAGDLADVAATGVAVAASHVHPGDLYVGLRGANAHGAAFSAEARERGAVAVLTDEQGRGLAADVGLPLLIAASPREHLGAISAWVYGTTDAPLDLFGITGTNGKTSTAYLLDAILRQLGRRTGLSTTAERIIDGTAHASRLTTPEAPEIHAMIALMRERGIEAATLEVSAQALVRHRVDGVVFDVVGFTNLSHDHLDDFGTMQSYLAAKAELFSRERARRGVVSLDSSWGEAFVEASEIPVQTITSRTGVDADWQLEVTEEHPDRTSFTLTSPDGGALRSSVPVIGAHMAANAGLAIAMLVQAGVPLDEIAAALQTSPIDVYLPGRAERVSGDRGPSVFVDFGHSADAYATTLAALRRFTPGRLIIICAANGNRDATKRPDMGRVAALGSDVVIVTDHHPRLEDPAAIRSALIAGALSAGSSAEVLEVIPPEQAIVSAVRMATEGDTILWAGPGHLDYRDVAGSKVPFFARDLARAALKGAGW
ncbi:MAG: UDP-N-acetylmuramoyl-L-alanyl-D-glutamate--2,6-diaminopimelate ligase [Microcella sp.]|nr:MAG: UDP-N-acetylmuramoyl-L-alanyl-D-glutamate--2,6-diaminopimelate ligase [Microcella sp.]